jgi:predicted nucleic acid-binding protein
MMVVSNTSPLIAFSKIDRFNILKELFGKVVIPDTVYEELLTNCTEEEKQRFISAREAFIDKVRVDEIYFFSRKLGRGEQEALTLAIRHHADLLLMDDRKGYNEAKEQNIKVASTRAILKITEERKIIGSYEEIEQTLRERSFFIPRY